MTTIFEPTDLDYRRIIPADLEPDLAVVKGVVNQIEVSLLTELSSDHCPIAVSYTHLDVYKRQSIILSNSSCTARRLE